MFERLTDRARISMALANQEAQRLNHEYIGTEHILLGLLKEGSGTAARVLTNLGIDLNVARREVKNLIKSGPSMVTVGKLPQTPAGKKVIEYAILEARNLQHSYVGTEHLLLGLMREEEGVAGRVLRGLGLNLEKVRDEVFRCLSQQASEDDAPVSFPYGVPQRLLIEPVPPSPGLARLCNEKGVPVSPPMRIELANEIAKRFNAQ